MQPFIQKLRTPICALLLFLQFFSALPSTAQESSDSAFVAPPGQGMDTVIKLNDAKSKDSVPGYYYRINGTYLKSYWTDFKYAATTPLHWKGRDWAKFATIIGGTGIIMLTLDEPVQEMMLRNQNEVFDKASEILYPLGNRFPPFLLAGMYATSIITHNRRMEHASLSVAKSLAISTVFYIAAKSVIRRQRPTRTDDPFDFAPPFTGEEYTSFPSGHTNTAFAVATAFSLEYNNKKWVPWVAYALASLTAISRLYDNRHWLSDIVIGASIGHFVTKAVYKQEYKRRAAGKINLKGVQ
ncbi:phosphatase PAP2 family protein [Chitinophagaceae bacterium LB-8]|uniref:Phosphatase PAP2 family protein n=1 Tax=Paraflavisolibacter caeni TaxID=2982496 RepID=A0A9X2XRT5_9BACT|nr:phosphatase PAP2 family protein [Paraflavisolibacter caeni]MCU7547669.1 phosphatase PAP2 family protein [Paraflavisolibacter caeni]